MCVAIWIYYRVTFYFENLGTSRWRLNFLVYYLHNDDGFVL